MSKVKSYCNVGSKIQTLLFKKGGEFSLRGAIAWLKENDFKYDSVDEKENTFRFRQESPDDFKPDSFRTTDFGGKLPKGVQAVIGCPKHSDMHASMEKGGDVPEVKIELIDYSVSVYEDSYENGEGANVNNWSKKENITFNSAEDLLKYLTTKVIYKDLAKTDFTAFEDGRITTSVTVDVNNYPASDSEIEKWKKGEMALYSANFDFYIALTERKKPTVEEMAKLFDIPSYKDSGGIMEKGGSVKGADKNKVLFDEEPLRIEMKDGVVNFDFDSRFKTGWAFDTNDVGEAAAIIRQSKFSDNRAVRSIPISKKQKEEINFFDVIYWLSGGNKEWRGGGFYTADYEVVYEKCFKKLFENDLIDAVDGAKTIGDLIDVYNQDKFAWRNFAKEAMSCNFAVGDEDEMAKGRSVPAKGTPEYYQFQMAKKIAKNPQLSGTVYMMSVKEAEKILGKTIKTEYPSFGEDFKEISDTGSTMLYARDFRDCEIDGQKIPLVAVATIRNLAELVNEDKLFGFDELPFDVTIEVFANPAFIAKKHWDSVRDMTGLDDSVDDMELFRDLADGYMSGARVASEAFKTKIKALKYLMSDKLKSKLDVDAAMVGFVLDRPVNRIGTTGWDVIGNMVNADKKLYAKGGEVADEERMIVVSLSKLVEYSAKIPAIVKGYSHLPAWIVSKISKVEQAIASVKHTLEPQYPQLFEKGGYVDKESDADYISMQCRHIGKYSKSLLAATKKGLKYEAWMKYLVYLSGDYVDSVYHFMDYKVNGKKYAKGGYVDTSSYIFVDADKDEAGVPDEVWEKYNNYPAKKYFADSQTPQSQFLFDYMVVQHGIADDSPKYVISNYYKDMMAHKDELNYHVDQTIGLFAEGGSIEDNYKEVNGTSYHKETDAAVIAALESARANNTRVKLYYGDVATGRNWNEENDTIGTIGRSGGKIKVPLLIATSRSSGGGAILDHRVVKIKDAKTGRVLYQNEKFVNPVVEIVPSDLQGYTHNVNIDGQIYSRHKSLKSAQMLQKKMMEDGGEVKKFAKGGGVEHTNIKGMDVRVIDKDDENGKYLEVGKVIAIIEPTKAQLKKGYTLVNYMVQFEDGELWAYLRSQIEVVTKPKKAVDVDSFLGKAAKKDIALLKEKGAMAITDTSRGNLWMEYKGGVFKIRNQIGNKIFEGDEAGAIQFVKKAYIVEYKNNPSLYELELEAVPNYDFGKGSHEASIRIKKYKVGASSLEDAKEKWLNFIEDNDLGSGNVPPLYLYKDGKKFGMFSYNGRLWNVGADGLYGDTEIEVGGNDLRKFENGGDVSSLVGATYRPFTGNSPEHYVKVIAIDFDNVTYRHKDGQEKTVKTKDFFDSWIQVAGSGSGIKKGDLVFCKDEGSRGLVGLVMTDEMEEGGNFGHNVYFRGLNGEEMFVFNSEMQDVLPNYLSRAEENGDLMHYPNIAKKQGIVLNPKYLAALEESREEYADGGSVHPIVDGYLEVNLLEEYKKNGRDVEYEEAFNKMKAKGNSVISDVNEEHGLKTGDIIQFVAGYNDDIKYTTKILGFDKDGDAYVLWDSYWYPVKLGDKRRHVKKMEKGGGVAQPEFFKVPSMIMANAKKTALREGYNIGIYRHIEDGDDFSFMRIFEGSGAYHENQILVGVVEVYFEGGIKKVKYSPVKESYEKGGSIIDKASSFFNKAKAGVKQKLHDEKKKIVLEVIDETRGKVKSAKDARFLHIADNLVDENYADGGVVWNAENIYKMAEEMTDAEYEKMYSELSERKKDSVKRLIRLGDTPKLALATMFLKKEDDENSDTWNLYRYAKGGQIQYDLRGDRKQEHMMTLDEFIAHHRRRIGKEAMAQPHILELFKKYYGDAIQNAINKGWYVEDIEKGKMTADNAKSIIGAAGLKVPENILAK